MTSHDPRSTRTRFVLLSLAVSTLLALLLASAGCTIERQVLFEDEGSGRSVAVLTGTEPPEPPASPAFAQLSALDAEASLRRLVVRPSLVVSFWRGDPQSFLSPDQLTWLRTAVAEQLPRLHPNQRLELRFRDRFHKNEVEVQVYGRDASLVYLFTKLSNQPDNVAVQPVVTPVQYVALEPQPGQKLDESNRKAIVLVDRVFDRGDVEALAANLALLAGAAKDGGVDEADRETVKALLEANPRLSSDAFRLFLDKFATIRKAREQGLFSAEEAGTRKAALIDELRKGNGG